MWIGKANEMHIDLTILSLCRRFFSSRYIDVRFCNKTKAIIKKKMWSATKENGISAFRSELEISFFAFFWIIIITKNQLTQNVWILLIYLDEIYMHTYRVCVCVCDWRFFFLFLYSLVRSFVRYFFGKLSFAEIHVFQLK